MRDTLAKILLWLLGVEIPQTGDGMDWHIEGAWKWSPGSIVLTVIMAVFCVALVGWLYRRERSTAGPGVRVLLAALRLSALALVMLMIFQLRLTNDRNSLPYLAVVIDESESMRHVDNYEDSALMAQLEQRRQSAQRESLRRIDVAEAILLADDARLLRELHRRYKVQIYAVAGGMRKLTGDVEGQIADLRALDAHGQSSRLGEDLRAVLDDLRGTDPAALMMLSDGIVTGGPSLAKIAPLARRRGTPLKLIGTGSILPTRSIELDDLLVDKSVFVNDHVDLEVTLVAKGLDGRTVQVVLKDKRTGEVLSRREVPVTGSDQTQKVRLSHRPTVVGPIEYVVDIDSPRQELSNKVVPLSSRVDVQASEINVLLVQGYPNYEYRYLKNMLGRDKTIKLKTVLQQADVEHAEQDDAALKVFPVGRDDLFKYNVIIFGDVDPGQLSPSALSNVADFVKVRGGGVVFISGPEFNPAAYRNTPLAGLLPFDLKHVTVAASEEGLTEPVPVRPTPLGLTSPHMQLGDTPAETEQIWNDLPPVYWFVEVPQLKAGARVLAEHPTRTGNDGRKLPLMVVENIPLGKVIWHAMDDTWRWRFRVGDTLFARYWIQTIRYLARSSVAGGVDSVQLTSDRREYERGAPVRLRVRFFDERLAPRTGDGVTVMLQSEGQKRRSVALSRDATSREIFTAEVSELAEGVYDAWVAAPSTGERPAKASFKVLAPYGELARLDMDVDGMREAAAESGGRFYSLAEVDQLLGELPPGRPVKIESKPPQPLWNNPRFLLLLVGLLVGEWLLRKKKGML